MGHYLLEISRAFHFHVATLDHGSRLDVILNGKRKAHGGPETQVPTSAAWLPEAAFAEGMGGRLCQPPPLKHCGPSFIDTF